MTEVETEIKANNHSAAIIKINENYANFVSDITKTTDSITHGNNDLTYIFNQWQGWTDDSKNMYQKGCTDSSRDQWAQSQSKCISGYSYITAGSSSYGNNYCLLYTEWSSTQLDSRYSTKPSKCSPSGSSDFSSVSQAASAYYSKINTYTNSNKDLISKLSNVNTDLDNSFTSMATKLLGSIDQIKGIITPLVQIFNSILGSGGFYDLINCCKFIK